jgi:phage repressor protein C with HTH and peptisase S24 domain
MSAMDNSLIYEDEQNKEFQAKPSEKGIPLIPLDAIAGFNNSESTSVMEYECERYVIPNFQGAEFLIQVKGSSMYPKYSSGDIVACKKLPLDTFFQWNKVYVLDTEQGVLIKRIKPADNKDRIICISDNEKYDPFELHKKTFFKWCINPFIYSYLAMFSDWI